jgi:lipoprotein-anchoring transpeptidase ErfK/SrfK
MSIINHNLTNTDYRNGNADHNTSGRLTRTVAVTIGLVLTLLFAACSPETLDPSLNSEAYDVGLPSDAADGGDESTSTFGAAEAGLFSASSVRAIVAVDELTLYDEPGGSPVGTMSSQTEYGTNRVFLVEANEGDWVRVRLPMRPNHSSSWVAAAEVVLDRIEPVVHIDLEARKLTVSTDDGLIAQTTVAVGSIENPTPRGTFYITDKLQTPEPGGAYGPFAFGLSGYSETISEFAGGNGQIGIHGTNDPGSLGEAVSHGCIRIPNDVIAWLANQLPLGTPVHVI